MQSSLNTSSQCMRRLPATLCILLVAWVAWVANDAHASGFPPFARADSAVVTRGGTVSVLENGSASVLDNDFDLENDQLFAFLSRNVKHGALTLNQDGTFVYRHNGNKKDDDEFSYVAFDGTGFSRRTRVRIEILPGDPVPPQIVGQDPVAVNEDASIGISITVLDVVDPDNTFPGDFTLEVSDGENYSRNNTTITPASNFNGKLFVPVRVFDGLAFSNVFSLDVDVLPQNDAPFTIGGPPDQEAIENIRFALELAGYFDDIDENESIRFSAGGLPQSGSLSIDPISGVLSGTPITADATGNAYNVTITATDSGGLRASIEFRLTIFADDRSDLAVTANLRVNPVTVGESTQWDIVINNLGPADLEEGELVAQWSTSGPLLTLVVPSACTILDNNSDSPRLSCSLSGLAANTSTTISVQGEQNGDGDNSLVAVAVADDPIDVNNSALVGAQVVAEFSEGPTQILSVSGSGVAGGDLDGDGFQDLVVTSDQTVVFLNAGDRTVTTPGVSLGSNSSGAAVVLLDWNGDSLPDIAVAGVPGQAARIYLNGGNGDFSETVEIRYANSGAIGAAAAADFDQNGFADLVLTGTMRTSLLRSFGQAEFSLTELPVGPGIDVSVADIDNDSYPDIIVVESADRTVRLLRNSGNGEDFATQGIQNGSVATATAADLNGDGYADLLLAIDGSDFALPESRIIYQLSDGSFPGGESIGASSLSKMLAGDVNGDSFADVIALNAAGVHQLYRGSAGGEFVLDVEQIVSEGMRGGILMDFNNDDSLDLIMAGPDSTVVEIYANNGLGRLGLGDRTAPVVQLIGEATVALAAGAAYVDPGVSATDDVDGDLTDSVLINGTFDTAIVGRYVLQYSVTDKAGNQGSATRVINVGVNGGTGGGGGGSMSPLFLLLQLLLLIYLLRFRACVARTCGTHRK